jgi:hypothetical protein
METLIRDVTDDTRRACVRARTDVSMHTHARVRARDGVDTHTRERTLNVIHIRAYPQHPVDVSAASLSIVTSRIGASTLYHRQRVGET